MKLVRKINHFRKKNKPLSKLKEKEIQTCYKIKYMRKSLDTQELNDSKKFIKLI